MLSPLLLTNNPTTTLAGALADGTTTTLTVASSATFGAASVPDYFMAALVDASDNVLEYLKVTAVVGTTWTVVRAAEDAVRYPAAARASGTKVVGILTAASLTKMLGGAYFDVTDFGADRTGAADSTTAIQRALDKARDSLWCHNVLIPDGNFLCGDLVGYTAVNVLGFGYISTLKQKAASTYIISVNPGSGGTTDPTQNARGMQYIGVRFLGDVGVTGFNQSSYLINWNAVSDSAILHCYLEDGRGDGVYIGSGNSAALERHNQRIRMQWNYFKGTANQRNPVSVIDGDDILFQYNYVASWGQAGTMPSGFDVEPNNAGAAYPVTRNIRVLDNTFDSMPNGIGGVFTVVLKSAQATLTVPARIFRFERNTITNCLGRVVFAQVQTGTPTSSTVPHDLYVRDNLAEAPLNGGYPFEIDKGLRGVYIERNTFRNFWGSARVGNGGVIVDFFARSNSFLDCGYGENSVVRIIQASTWVVENNYAEHGGATPTGPGYFLSLEWNGAAVVSDTGRVRRNTLIQGSSNSFTKLLNKHASHTPTDCRVYDNDIPSGVTTDQATGIDYSRGAVETFTYAVTGTLAVAAGKSQITLEGASYILLSARARVNTAPVGASVIVDVNKNGTTIYGTQANRPTIAAAGSTALGGAASVTTFAAGDVIAVDVDQVGTTTPGADLIVTVRVARVS